MFKSFVYLVCAACVALPAHAYTPDARAAVVQAWQQYRQGVQSEQELIEVRVTQDGQAVQEKRLWRRIQNGAQGQKLSIKFVAPADDQGLGLLVERGFVDGDQIWLRLPSWSGGRKVVGNRELKYFADTGFTFEDSKQLIGESAALFDYRYLPPTAQGALVVATPKPGVLSGYARREICLNAQGVPVKTDYFDADGQLIKTLSFEAISFAAPGRWRADRIVLRHFQQHSVTVLTVKQRQFNVATADSLFTLPYLLEPENALVR